MTDPGTHDPARRNGEPGPGLWIGGAVLIGVGILFLLQNLGYSIPGNWWALFLLIPAVAAFRNAIRLKQEKEGIYFGQIIVGGVLVALMLLFLFDIDEPWHVAWPLLVIVAGCGLLINAARSR